MKWSLPSYSHEGVINQWSFRKRAAFTQFAVLLTHQCWSGVDGLLPLCSCHLVGAVMQCFVPSRDSRSRRRFTCSFLRLQWEPSLANRVNTLNSCLTLQEPPSRWVPDRWWRRDGITPPASCLVRGEDLKGLVGAALYWCAFPAFRLLLQKEWMPSRGWSLSLDHQKLNLRFWSFMFTFLK